MRFLCPCRSLSVHEKEKELVRIHGFFAKIVEFFIEYLYNYDVKVEISFDLFDIWEVGTIEL